MFGRMLASIYALAPPIPIIANMIKNLTKAEYYKEKRIPLVTPCRRLQPEQPVRAHLIENLPRLGTEFEKIRSQTACQNKINLELANALKIIHELEYELEIMTTTCHQNEEELFVAINEKKELGRKIAKLEDRIMQLEGSLQKNQFNMKVRIESEKEQYYAIVNQYERKIQELTDAYNRLKVDREKELKNAEQFHESSLSRANLQLQEIESSAQSDVKKFQKELEKAVQDNGVLRQKITELETCNLEHLRDLRKVNSELTQANLQIKNTFEHKIITLEAQLHLQLNKNKELIDSIAIWEGRIGQEANMWQEEKNALIRQNTESQNLWKRSYDELLKQKQKFIQEINKKSCQINERDRELVSLRDRVRKLERQIGELGQERNNLIASFEIGKRQQSQRMQGDYEMKLNENLTYYQKQLSIKVNEAVENERQALQQKFRVQTQKYLQKITFLEGQLIQKSNQLLSVQQSFRKSQSLLQQHKIQLDFLARNKNQQQQSFKNQLVNVTGEYENRIKHFQSIHVNQMEKMKSDHGAEIDIVRNGYENRVRELSQMMEGKEWQFREMQAKTRRLEEEFANQRMSFIARVQSFEVTIGRIKNQNEQLVKNNANLQANLQGLDKQFRNLEVILRQEVDIKNRVVNDLQIETENSKRVREELAYSESAFVEKVKTFQLEIFDLKRKDSLLTLQIQGLKKKIKDLELNNESLKHELKVQEANKIALQKKLLQIDTSSQQKWKLVEADFQKMNKKLAEDWQNTQKQLRLALGKKQQQLAQLNTLRDQLESTLIKQRNEFAATNITWQNKCKQLEEANKKLIKSSFTMQDVERDNAAKETTISNLKRQIEKLSVEISGKNKSIGELNGKVGQYQRDLESIRTQMEKKNFQIKGLNIKITEMGAQLKEIKNKMAKQIEDISQKQSSRNEQLRKRNEQIKSFQNLISQAENKYLRVIQQKKKLEIRIQQIQKQQEEELRTKKSEKVESIRRISELENACQQIQITYKEKLSKFEQQLASKNLFIGDRDSQVKKLLKKIDSLETDSLALSQELKSVKQKLEAQKTSTSEFRSQLQRLRQQRMDLDRKIKSLSEQIELLEKQREKTEKDIVKIYDENEKRVQIAIQDTKLFYEKQLQNKNIELEQIRKKIKASLEQQREEYKKKQAKLSEQKQQMYKEVIEKTCKITEITIAYEELGQIYEQVFKELQIYKKKWNKMFCEFSDNNEELTDINFKINDFRTEDRKVKKIVKQTQEIRTEKTERMMTATENQTPISLNATTKGQQTGQTFKQVSAFSHSDSGVIRGSGGNNKLVTTLMSDSGVIVSRDGNHSSGSMSVRLDCSSVSSKFSNKE